MRHERIKQGSIGNDSVLQRFVQTAGILPIGQRLKRKRIGKHETGLVKCPHQIFHGPIIDSGLPANTGVHLRQQRGGNLNDGNSPHVERSDETR